MLLFAVLVVFAIIVVAKSVALIPQAEAAVIERLGRYSRTVSGQLTLLIPFIDRVRARVDLRERVVSFPPQPVITEDNLTLNIDTVVYFQVTVPQAAVYEISNYIVGVEQLTTTTLRNVVGGMTLEQTLTSRDQINGQLRGVLDEATGRWGLRVARVELRSIDPPPSIQASMEKQMKADREKRAMILTAEGTGRRRSRRPRERSSRRSWPPRAPSRPRSLPPKPIGNPGYCARRVSGPPPTCRRRDRPRRSRRRSRPSRPAVRLPRCWPTSTCRRCRKSPRATRTRCGWCPATSAPRCRASPSCSGRRAMTGCSVSCRRRRQHPGKPEDDSDVADWFSTETDPAIAAGGGQG